MGTFWILRRENLYSEVKIALEDVPYLQARVQVCKKSDYAWLKHFRILNNFVHLTLLQNKTSKVLVLKVNTQINPTNTLKSHIAAKVHVI